MRSPGRFARVPLSLRRWSVDAVGRPWSWLSPAL